MPGMPGGEAEGSRRLLSQSVSLEEMLPQLAARDPLSLDSQRRLDSVQEGLGPVVATNGTLVS